ncbi:hypothetical protein KQI52_15130 [bacterium]|nr:hypothetical protein [bacterium]
MNLTGLHLLLSYQCTSECDHCFVQSSPRARGTMTLEFARSAIRQAAEMGGFSDIAIEGGEPFLFYPILLGAVREAVDYGLDVALVSNGYFATSVEDAEEYLRPLKQIFDGDDSGFSSMLSLSISDDEYHGGGFDSPAERAREAASRLGIEVSSIAIDQPCVVEHDKIKGEPILGGGVRFRGRAAEKLVDDPVLPRRPWMEFSECPDENWTDLGRVHLDGYGNLFTCQGVVIGNMKNKPLAHVLADYEPFAHPIIGPLARSGPAGLVKEYNLDLKGDYLDACELCYKARKELRQRFPEQLAPPVVFGVEEEVATQASA